MNLSPPETAPDGKRQRRKGFGTKIAAKRRAKSVRYLDRYSDAPISGAKPTVDDVVAALERLSPEERAAVVAKLGDGSGTTQGR